MLDFDAAWSQESDPPLEARVHGRTHLLPPSMPAGFRLHMWRVRMEHGIEAQLSIADLEAGARFLFGREVVDGWLEELITENHLTDVVLSVSADYAQREATSRAEGNAPGASGAPTT